MRVSRTLSVAFTVGMIAGTVVPGDASIRPHAEVAVVEPAVVKRAPLECFGRKVTMYGSAGADFILGTDLSDVIHARAGADTIVGRGGHDRICGGSSGDEIVGQIGYDRANGGRGIDLCDAEKRSSCP